MAKNYEKAYKDRKRGMSYKDIAAKYHVSINTVKSWKTRQWAAMDVEDAHKAHKDAHTCTPAQAAEAIQAKAERISKAGAAKAKADSDNINKMRQMVEYKKAHGPAAFGVKDIKTMIQRIGQYFQDMDAQGRPYTRAGLILALGVSKATYYRYLNSELDYLLEEHITINDIDVDNCDTISLEDGSEIPIDEWGNPLITFSSVLQKALLRLEEQAEQRLYDKARPGDIFTLKQYGWTDERSPNTVNQTLVIADRDEAQAALNRLYGGALTIP